MRSFVGFAMLFIAVGILSSYFMSGFIEFFIATLLLAGAYLLLCRC